MGAIKTKKYSIEYTIDGDMVVLDYLEVKKEFRGKGWGEKAMIRFIKKFMGWKIELHAYPQDYETSTERLVSFYKKFGFEVVIGSELSGYEMCNY
jgi:ribosomal protein S18 acetylase RimI-like enzyme